MKSSKSLKSVGSVPSFKSKTSQTQNPYMLDSKPESSKLTFKLKTNSNIETQLTKAFAQLKKIQSEIKSDSKKVIHKKSQCSLDDLFLIQDNVKAKDRQIKKLAAETKEMKLFKRKQDKALKQYTKQKESSYGSDYLLQKNQEQIRLLKKTLEQLRNIHGQKQINYSKKKQNVASLTTKYIQSCARRGVQPISFQEYLNREEIEKQTRSTSSKMSEFSKKLTSMTIKQIVNNPYSIEELQHTEQNLIELKTRKQILEGSLRTTKRKNQKQVLQLKQTLEQLTQRNQTLQTKCYEKYKQKETIDELKKH